MWNARQAGYECFPKTIRLVQEVLESQFIIALPMIHQENVTSFQLVVNSIFEIDPALKKVESLDGVKSAEVFIPQRGRMHQDWILREIDENINANEKHQNIL